MPTYTNNSSVSIKVENYNGLEVTVNPGDSVQLNYYTSDTKFTLTADTPYYNRVKARHSVTLSGTAQDVLIDSDTNYIAVVQITGSITAYCQSSDNTPPELENWTSDDPIVQIPASSRFTKLVVIGSGTCEIIEYV